MVHFRPDLEPDGISNCAKFSYGFNILDVDLRQIRDVRIPVDEFDVIPDLERRIRTERVIVRFLCVRRCLIQDVAQISCVHLRCSLLRVFRITDKEVIKIQTKTATTSPI